MSNYVKSTNFAVKDTLITGDPDKKIKGTEIDAEYNNIATAVNSKANTASPTLTGTPAAPTATAGTNTTQLATTAFVTAADVAERTATATLTNKTLTTPTINTPTIATPTITNGTITGGSISGLSSPLPIASGGTGLIASGVSGNVLTSNGSAWVSSAPASPFTWNVVNVDSSATTYTIPANAIMVLGTAISYMGGNQGSRVAVYIKNSGGTTLYTYNLTGGNEDNGTDGGSGMQSRSAWSVAIPSSAIGGTLEFFRAAGSGGWSININQAVLSV